MATNGPLGPAISFMSRTTKTPLMVIEQKASSRSAEWSMILSRTSVMFMPSVLPRRRSPPVAR
jgi:hypothetical protein